MNVIDRVLRSRTGRILAVAFTILALDQVTKVLVLRHIGTGEIDVIKGFFKLVNWANTGAAWSLFRGNNKLLAVVAIVALVVLFFSRHHFNSRTLTGQIALGLIFGGIMGNLIDRVRVGYVVDFLYFYIEHGGEITGFPAFNVADSAICVGVGLVFLVTWKMEHMPKPAEPSVME